MADESKLLDLWRAPNNAMFPLEGRCLMFAEYSDALRDCHCCRTVAYCRRYDHAGTRQQDVVALVRWENEGGATPK